MMKLRKILTFIFCGLILSSINVYGLQKIKVEVIEGLEEVISNQIAAISITGVAIDGDIIPVTSNAYDLGSETFPFKDLYISSGTVYMDGVPLDMTPDRVILNGNSDAVQSIFTYVTTIQPYYVSTELVPNNNFYSSDGWDIVGDTNQYIIYSDELNKFIFSLTNSTIPATTQLKLENTAVPVATIGRDYKIITMCQDAMSGSYYTFEYGGVIITNSGNVRTENVITAINASSLLVGYNLTEENNTWIYHQPSGVDSVSIKEYCTTNVATYPAENIVSYPTIESDWFFTGDCFFENTNAGIGPVVNVAGSGTAYLRITPEIEVGSDYSVSIDIRDYNNYAETQLSNIYNIACEVGGHKFDVPSGGMVTSVTALANAAPKIYMTGRVGWLAGYNYRREIIIDGDYVDGLINLTDYPMLLITKGTTITNSLKDSVNNVNGYDIVFTDKNGESVLDHEIEMYTESNGEFIGWIRIPTVKCTGDTIFYMYYGGDIDASDPQNVSDVWDANYRGVWHMNGMSDSTLNENDGNSGGGTDLSDGYIGKAQYFGGGDEIVVPYSSTLKPTTALTIEVWAKPTSLAYNYKTLVCYPYNYGTHTSHYYEWMIMLRESNLGKVQACIDGSFTDAVGSSLVDEWHYWAMTWSGSSQRANLYKDGSVIDNYHIDRSVISYQANNPVLFGRDGGDGNHWLGWMDEVRLSDITRSTAWLATCSSNIVAPTLFCQFGAERDSGVIGDNERTHISFFEISKYKTETYSINTTSKTNIPVWQAEDHNDTGIVELDMSGVSVTSDGDHLYYPEDSLQSITSVIITNDLFYLGNELISNNFFHTSFGWDIQGSYISYVPLRAEFLHDGPDISVTGKLTRSDIPSAVIGRNYLIRYTQNQSTTIEQFHTNSSGGISIISWGGVSFPVYTDNKSGGIGDSLPMYIETNIIAITTDSLAIDLVNGTIGFSVAASAISVREYYQTNTIVNNISWYTDRGGNICPTVSPASTSDWVFTGDCRLYDSGGIPAQISVGWQSTGAESGTAYPRNPISFIPGVDYLFLMRTSHGHRETGRSGSVTVEVAGVTFNVPPSGITTNFTALNTDNLIINLTAGTDGLLLYPIFIVDCLIQSRVTMSTMANLVTTTSNPEQWTEAYNWGSHTDENYTKWMTPPLTSDSIGIRGQVSGDGSYFYFCYDTDQWGRVSWTTSW